MSPAEVPEGSIVITPAQFYSETREALTEIKRDIATLNTAVSTVPAQVADHETRIRVLERFKFVVVGAALVGGGLSAGIARVVYGG